MTAIPSFPPMMKGFAAGPANPFKIAVDQARRGVDSGLLTWSIVPERLRAALVLAPETPLEEAMAGFCTCAVGFQNALGALAPPETALHLEWSGGIRLNGGYCGGLHIAASTNQPDVVPDWLVVGVDLTLTQAADLEPGDTPDRTALDQEGCGDVVALELLEAWSRHTLVWLNDLDEPGGRARLHREWSGLAWKLGEVINQPVGLSRADGVFMGVDENFGMILKSANGETRLIALSSILEEV
jgi:BirA family transcriptional regulator, biotin operon repressor / biotin---[acetyl-CoA-carboxylase] ligase